MASGERGLGRSLPPAGAETQLPGIHSCTSEGKLVWWLCLFPCDFSLRGNARPLFPLLSLFKALCDVQA